MSKNEKIRKPLGDRLIKSIQQAVDFAEGKDVPGIRVHVPADCDVRKIRSRLKLSQREFARRYGFSIDSVQNWEQGRRIPDGPARTLLAVIRTNLKLLNVPFGRRADLLARESRIHGSHKPITEKARHGWPQINIDERR